MYKCWKLDNKEIDSHHNMLDILIKKLVKLLKSYVY